MPLFSIIIPTYNRAELLAETLASVLKQESTDCEIFVVDDGSTDETREYLTSLHGRINVLHQDNRGPGSARNCAVALARGEYVAFLDSDDIWFPWTLGLYRKIIEANGHPAIVVGKPWIFESSNQLASPSIESPFEVAYFADYLASGTEWRWWGVSSFVIRRDVLQKCGGFVNDWINGEDADLMLRLGTAPGFVQVTAPETFGYRRHAASAMANLDRTFAGAQKLIESEKQGLYPGGLERAKERRRIITRHIRPISLELLARKNHRAAFDLYRSTFNWNAWEGRWRYLLGYTALALRHSAYRSCPLFSSEVSNRSVD